MIELAGLLILGFFAQWLAWRIKVPAILPLILVGLAVGPVATLFTEGGERLIDGDSFFKGDLLFDVVSLSVGLILFEGGMTLKFSEVKKVAGTVLALILLGSFITLFAVAFASHWVMGINWPTAFLFSSLVIVTGPTVIGPILRNVRPNFRVSIVLKWEGILIDPIGALIAVVIFEYLVEAPLGENIAIFFIKALLLNILSGGGVAAIFGFITVYALNKKLIPHYLLNTVMLGIVIFTFVAADAIHKESGLTAVTILGMVLANMKVPNLKSILSFKEDVTMILISVLFIILSSRVDIESLLVLGSWNTAVLFFIIIWIIRPLGVFICSAFSNLKLKDKLFISSMSPRGIVAAGVASIFTFGLEGAENPRGIEVEYILPLTFMVIVGTVVLQGLTAKPLAKILDVTRKTPSGVLFLGANEPARFMAKLLMKYDVRVTLADTSQANVREAKAANIPVFEGSLLDEETLEDFETYRYGQMWAMTPNTDLNILACKQFVPEVGEQFVFRLTSQRELDMKSLNKPTNLLMIGKRDYIGLTQFTRRKPIIREKVLENKMQLISIMLDKSGKYLPLFVIRKKQDGVAFAYPVTLNLEMEDNDLLIYAEK